MLEFFPSQTAKEKPIPESPVSAKSLNWDKLDPSLARHSLEQAQAFYLLCNQLGLPVSSPFAFFTSLDQLLADPTSLTKHTAQCLSLLLLYNAYGNMLFDSSYPTDDVLSVQASSLLRLESIRDFRKAICSPSLFQFFQQSFPLNKRVLFQDGAEFFYCEELNCRFAALREEMSCLPIQSVSDTYPIDANEAEKLCEIFCGYHADISGIAPNKRKETYTHLKDRLSLSLELHRQATHFAQITTITLNALSEAAAALGNALRKYPLGTSFHKSLAQFFHHDQQLHGETSRDYYDAHVRIAPKTANDLSFALAALSVNTEEPYQGSVALLQKHLQNLLNCYQSEPLFEFFVGISNILSSQPQLKPYASVYVWMLFHHHANQIFKASPSMLKGKKPVVLSYSPLFEELQDELLSEERTSERHLQVNVKLFETLVSHYLTKGSSYTPDRPMCEHLLSRLLRKQIYTFSDTSILGSQLKHAKPLFRNLAVFHDHLSQMHSGLWQNMPRKSDFAVDPEQADAFFRNNMSHSAKAMKHLLERSGRVPDARKKVLTLAHCREVVRMVFLSNEKADEIPQQLTNWMHLFLNSDPILQATANQSETSFANLQFAVYRLALARYAKSLSRKLMHAAMQVLYYPVPDNITSFIWNTCFSYHQHTRSMNRFSDKILLGDQILPARIMRSLSKSTTSKQLEESISTPITYIISSECPYIYRDVLQKTRDAKCLFRPLLGSKNTRTYLDDFLQSMDAALDAGFDGIEISAFEYELIPSAFRFDSPFTDRFNLELANLSAPFSHLIQSIRQRIGSYPIILLRIIVPSLCTRQDKEILRILTRWFADCEINGIILSSTDQLSPTDLSKLADSIASAFPIPIFLDYDPSLHQVAKSILQLHQVDGLVFCK